MTFKKAGQITLLTAIIGASGMILASAFTSWATTYGKVQKVQQETSILEERENNHFLELTRRLETTDKKLESMDKKLDALILKK